MLEGVQSETALKLYAHLRKRMRAKFQEKAAAAKASSASEIIGDLEADYGVDLSDIPTELPDWFMQAAAQRLDETFEKPYWQAVNDTTRDQLQGLLTVGIRDGMSMRELAKGIGEIAPERAGYRAMAVARTEVSNALNAGHELGIRQTGEETGLAMGKSWMSIHGPTTREDHADADGQVVPVDDLFTVGGESARWPGDENLSASQRINCQCLPFYSRVASIGTTVAASKMLYSGRLVKLVTRSGCRLDVTPNHPVLTTQGWIAAGELQAGMYLARYVGVDRTLAGENEQHEPASIEEVFESIRSAASLIERRPRLPLQFHGDARNGQGEVETAVANVKLPLPSSAKQLKRRKKCGLMLAASQLSGSQSDGSMAFGSVLPSRQLHVGQCPHNAMLPEYPVNDWPGNAMLVADSDFTDTRQICRHDRLLVDRSPSLDVGLSEFGFGSRADGDSSGLELADDRGPVAPGNSGNGSRRIAGGVLLDNLRNGQSKVSANDSGSIAATASNAKGIQPCPDRPSRTFEKLGNSVNGQSLVNVEPDQLVGVDEGWYVGHVYDLQTTKGMYVADGLVVHNCTIISDFVAGELDAEIPDDYDAEDQSFLPDVDADIEAENPTPADTFVEPQDVVQTVPEPIVEPEPPKPDYPMGIPPLSELRPVQGGSLGGSTGAALYEDAAGNRYVVKRGSSPAHLREEFTAEELYRALKVPIPDSRLIEDGDRPVKISKFIQGTPLSDLSEDGQKAAIKQLRKGFAADALLANWDVAGLSLDNVIVAADGTAYRIDVGGALRFRAQGGDKGGAFGSHALEIWTLRDPAKNSSGASVFGDMSFREIRDSAKATLKAMSKNEKAFDAVFNDDPNLGMKLSERAASLKQMVESATTLTKDKYRWEYADTFTKHEMQQDAAGLYRQLPKKLVEGERAEYELKDENGKEFDDLRGQTGMGAKLEKYCESQGLPFKIIDKYASEQAGSSWSEGAIAHKEWILRTTKVKASEYYLGNTSDYGSSPLRTEAEFKKIAKDYDKVMGIQLGRISRDKIDETRAAQHAFFTNFVRKVDLPGNNREAGFIDVVRTENAFVMDKYGYKVGDVKNDLKRGACESFSQTNVYTLKGSELTLQQVPHHRVYGHYALSRGREGYGGFLMGDHENEIVCDARGLDVAYVGKGESGEAIDRTEFEILKKKKPPKADTTDSDDQ